MGIRSLAELREVEAPPWIWEGFLAPGSVTLLSASPKVGKTTLLAHMLHAMYTEDSFLGKPINPRPTLIISEEADTLIAQRADALGYSDMWPIFWQTPEGLTWEQLIKLMRDFATTWYRPLIIVDTLSRHWGIDDENDNAKVEKIMTSVIHLARTTGAAVMLVHHNRKSGGRGGTAPRGGSALVGAVDIVIEVFRPGKDEDEADPRRFIKTYSRYGETPSSLVISLDAGVYTVQSQDEGNTAVTPLAAHSIRAFLLSNPGWWRAESIAIRCGLAARTVRQVLAEMTDLDARGGDADGKGVRGKPREFQLVEGAFA